MPRWTLGFGGGGDQEPRYPGPLQQEELLDSGSRLRSQSSRARRETRLKRAYRATFGRLYQGTLGRSGQHDPRSLEAVFQRKHGECQALERRESRLKEEIESAEQLQKETEKAMRELKETHGALRKRLESVRKKRDQCEKQEEEILQHFAKYEEQRLRRRAAKVLRA